MAKWNESEHPRDDDGKFTDGTGSQWTTSKRDYSNIPVNLLLNKPSSFIAQQFNIK